MKKLLLTTILALLSVVVASAQEMRVIPIESSTKGLYLVVDRDGKLYQSHFGDKLNNGDEIKTIFARSNKRSAYPTFGTGYMGEPALNVIHSDENYTTRLKYQSHTSESIVGCDVTTSKMAMWRNPWCSI
ncbi:MAG: glycoside hydrolase family 36 N-terminal domain-containing protein, partial [Rikenellaceae bacterium]